VSADGVHYTHEPGVRFAVDGRIVIDCAVALHNGVFHLIAPDNGSAADMADNRRRREQPRGGTGYHAVSKDGIKFERAADVTVPGNRRWLGNMQSDGNRLVFFGTGDGGPGTPGGVWMATSLDGASWMLDSRTLSVPCADPGVVKLCDGSWLVLGTGPPRAGTASVARGRPMPAHPAPRAARAVR
jgi:hypothetical protein